jgi:hypothetical protein
MHVGFDLSMGTVKSPPSIEVVVSRVATQFDLCQIYPQQRTALQRALYTWETILSTLSPDFRQLSQCIS